MGQGVNVRRWSCILAQAVSKSLCSRALLPSASCLGAAEEEEEKEEGQEGRYVYAHLFVARCLVWCSSLQVLSMCG